MPRIKAIGCQIRPNRVARFSGIFHSTPRQTSWIRHCLKRRQASVFLVLNLSYFPNVSVFLAKAAMRCRMHAIIIRANDNHTRPKIYPLSTLRANDGRRFN